MQPEAQARDFDKRQPNATTIFPAPASRFAGGSPQFAPPPAHVRSENYAFLVAVQDYSVKSLRPLKFTRNDIQQFAKLLESSGFNHENIVLMTDKAEQPVHPVQTYGTVFARAAFRGRDAPVKFNNDMGFRVVRTVPAK